MTDRINKRAEPTHSLIAELSPEETRKIINELHTHQIELEMQNEELRRTQVELYAARMRYFALYDLAPVGYCTLNKDGQILEANFTSASLLGVNRSLLVNQPFSRFIFKDDQDIYYLYQKMMLETSDPQSCKLRMVKNDGSQFWAHLAATLAQETDGTQIIRIVLSNITDRINIETLLSKSEAKTKELAYQNAKSNEQYRNMLATTGDGFLLINEAGKIVDTNERYIQLSGYSRDELLTISITDLEAIETEQQTHEHIAKTILNKHDLFETQHRTKNGQLLDLEVSVTYQESTRQFLSFFRDISERKKILQQETQARKEAEIFLQRALLAERNLLKISEETQQRLGQELHDDLGQQITGIALLSAVLSQDLIKAKNPLSKDVQKITKRLNQAVSRIRQLSHGLCPITSNNNDLLGLLKSLADETMGIHGIVCKFRYDTEPTVTSYFDYGDMPTDEITIQLFRIAQEAVTNCIKHSRASQIELFLKHDDKGDMLEISDNGIGISRENINTGLGVYSMTSRAHMINTEISFNSGETGRICVAICLPKDKNQI